MLDDTQTGGAMKPRRANRNPVTPDNKAHVAITKRSFATGEMRAAAGNLDRDPARAARASNVPRNAPTHQVAIIPQPRPSIVGDWVPKTGGWKIVKYSTQMRAVNWS